jgi:hypothetical protein
VCVYVCVSRTLASPVSQSRHRVSGHVTKVLDDVTGVVGDLARHFGDVTEHESPVMSPKCLATCSGGHVHYPGNCALAETFSYFIFYFI